MNMDNASAKSEVATSNIKRKKQNISRRNSSKYFVYSVSLKLIDFCPLFLVLTFPKLTSTVQFLLH